MNRQNGLESQNPISEIKRTFRGTLIPSLIMLVVAFLIGTFLSGLVYQYIGYTFGKMRRFNLINSFAYGLSKTMLVSIMFTLGIYYCYYKVLRIRGKNRVDYETGIVRSENETFGGAHWQTDDELKENFTVSKKIADTKEEIFGKDPKGNVYSLTYPPGMNHNRVFFGAPGSGKTSAIIKTDIYQCILRGESIITTDSKGAVYEETVSVAKEHGYTVRVFNLKPKEFRNSNAFNVMESIDPDSPDFASDCAVISNIIIKNIIGVEADKGLDYWGTTETVALQMVIMLLSSRPEYIKSGQNNLYSVFEFLSTKTPMEMKQIFTALPMDSPTRMAYNNFAKASEQNQGQTLNGLTTHLGVLNNPMLKEVLSRNEIDLIAPMRKPCIYYVIIPDNDDTYKFLASLFFSTIFKVQCDYSDSLTKEEKKKQLTVFYELDEYKNIGGIINLDTKMSTVRSRKINITVILQLLNQLTIVHGEDRAAEILNDCTVKGLLSTNDMDTAKYFSDLIGTFTAKSESEKYQEARTDVMKMHNDVMHSVQEQERKLVLPEELMNDKMDRDDVIYVISNMAPVRLKKCFAEKGGELIHPMEIRGAELGYKKSNRYKPKWRNDKEQKEVPKTALKPEVVEKIEVKDEPRIEESKKEITLTPESEVEPVAPKPKLTLTEVTEPKPATEEPKKKQSSADKLNMLLNGEI